MMIEAAEGFLSAEMERKGVPGFSAAVVKGREIVWAKGFGYASVEEEVPASPGTVFRVASVSKPVIATGLLQWLDRGKFRLDDPVNGVMEDMKIRTGFKEELTVRNLLTHTSGLPVHVDPVFFDLGETITLEELIRGSAIAVRPPNEEIVYSNTAFNIIGYLVGMFAGEPYPEYVKESLFDPLDMRSSAFEQTPEIRKLMAQPYSRKKAEEPLEAVRPWYGASIPEKPCGSLFTTATDLGHFLVAQMNGGRYNGRKILKKETVDEMHRLQAGAGASRSGYALAWKRTWHHGRPMLSHTGGNLGWTAHVAFYPELKVGIAILCNLNDNSGWRPPARQALHLLVGGTLSFETEEFRRDDAQKRWGNLAGTYARQFQKAEIRVEEGNLILARGSEKAYLEELEASRYTVHGTGIDGAELTFEFDDHGTAKQFDLETEVFPREAEERRPVDGKADLRGTWQGEFVTPYGYFTMDLRVEGPTEGHCTDLSGNMVPLQDFEARAGLVTGRFRFKNLPGYVGWGAEWYDATLSLSAMEGGLEGYMALKSEIGESKVPLRLSKIRSTP